MIKTCTNSDIDAVVSRHCSECAREANQLERMVLGHFWLYAAGWFRENFEPTESATKRLGLSHQVADQGGPDLHELETRRRSGSR